MLAFLSALLGFADPIAKITAALANARVDLAKAANDTEKIHAEERVRTLEIQLNAAASVQAEEAKNPISAFLNSFMRFLLALPVVAILWKYIMWDKVIGSFLGYSRSGSIFETDALDPNMWNVVVAVIGFYLLHAAITRR